MIARSSINSVSISNNEAGKIIQKHKNIDKEFILFYKGLFRSTTSHMPTTDITIIRRDPSTAD